MIKNSALLARLKGLASPMAEALGDKQRLDAFCQLAREIVAECEGDATISYPLTDEQRNVIVRRGARKLREAERDILAAHCATEDVFREVVTKDFHNINEVSIFKAAASIVFFLGSNSIRELASRDDLERELREMISAAELAARTDGPATKQ